MSDSHVIIEDMAFGSTADTGPLIGRQAELDAILAVTGAERTGRAALVSGDAGVGKTRLLSELVDRARADGEIVLTGHCVHFGGDSVPYLPISEAFGRLAREQPQLADRLREHYPPIERLLPQRRVIGAPTAAGAPLDWSDLFEAIWAALATMAEERAVLLVIEDAHWADSGTRDLIGFLLNRMTGEPVTLVVSYRTDDLHRRHPLRTLALEWGRIPGVARIALGPLDEVAMRSLVSLRSARALDEKSVRTVLQRAGGNAFFAEQLVAEIDGSDHAPSDLADLLLMRLDRLSGDARTVVRVAAVAGRQVSHTLIAAVAGLGDVALDGALREAVDAHVLDRSGSDRYRFHHALLAEAVYDDLLPGERVRLHRTFAAALAAGTVLGTDADLARHAREAMDIDTAFAATVRAGEEAMRVAAPNEAMRHYEAALTMIEQVDLPTLSAGELALRAADAASAAGHQHRALQLVRDALDQLPPGAGVELRAELLLAVTEHALGLDGSDDFFTTSLEAFQLVPDMRTALRARTLAVHAHASAAVYRDDDAIRLAGQARDLAEHLDLPEVAADAGTTVARLRERSENPADAAALMQSALEQAEQAGNLGAKLRGQYSLGLLYYDTGNLPLAAEKLRIAMRTAEEGGRPWAIYGFDARIALSQARYVTGEWDESLRLCDVGSASAPPLAEVALAATASLVRAGRGELGSVDELDQQRPWWRRDGMTTILAAAPHIDALTERGETDAALDLHDEAVALVAEVWQNTWFQARIRLHSLALAALSAGVATAGSARRPALVERGRVLIGAVETTVAQGLLRRPIQGPEGRAWCQRAHAEWARLRWTAGIDAPTADELVNAWRAAVDGFGYGHVFEQARSQTRLAAALQVTGDSAAAQPVADQARETARALGAEPLLTELRSLALRPTRPARAEGADATLLTPREQQVLGLITEGRTNRQIARSLYISEKTVSVHVSNILAKLGASGRTEAAAIARRDGLLVG